jgi:hypothetical protein
MKGWLVLLTPKPEAKEKFEKKTSCMLVWTTDPIRCEHEINWPVGHKTVRLGVPRKACWELALVVGPVPTDGSCGVLLEHWRKSRKLELRMLRAIHLVHALVDGGHYEIYARDVTHLKKLIAEHGTIKQETIYKYRSVIEAKLKVKKEAIAANKPPPPDDEDDNDDVGTTHASNTTSSS